jgi:hypothetical protein
VGHMPSAAATVPLATQGRHMAARDDADADAKGERPEDLHKGSVAPSAFGDLAYCQTLSEGISMVHIAEESKVDPTSVVCMDWSEVACQLVPLAGEVKMDDMVGVVGAVDV